MQGIMMCAAQSKLDVTVLAAQKFINWSDQISENYFNEIISICIGGRISQFQKITELEVMLVITKRIKNPNAYKGQAKIWLSEVGWWKNNKWFDYGKLWHTEQDDYGRSNPKGKAFHQFQHIVTIQKSCYQRFILSRTAKHKSLFKNKQKE